jgi:5-methylcytosine-specific restriction endonuclease McrA
MIKKKRRQLLRWEREKIWKDYHKKCNMCKRHLEYTEMTIDHIEELQDGGRNNKNNLQPLCESCHFIKNENRKLYILEHI